jgi:hypothetical protein
VAGKPSTELYKNDHNWPMHMVHCQENVNLTSAMQHMHYSSQKCHSVKVMRVLPLCLLLSPSPTAPHPQSMPGYLHISLWVNLCLSVMS